MSAPATTAATVVRLRPVVHATPTPQGVHVRGWASSFTVSGGAGLWKVWQALAGWLADGVAPDVLEVPATRPEVARVITMFLTELRAHDMLVEVPAGWSEAAGPDLPAPDLARWLESVAGDPKAAWDRLRATRVVVDGAGGPAEAAIRALRGAGVTATPAAASPDTGSGRLRLTADDGTSVVARCAAEVGFVLPPIHDRHGTAAGEVAREVADRLGPAGPGTDVPYPLAALVGGAAAHRLVCAVAGLPDPAEEAADLGGTAAEPAWAGLPAVLVVRLDPLRAGYHPWLWADAPGAEDTDDEPDLAAIDRRLKVLGDPDLGVLPPALAGELPQVPAMLAQAGAALGVAVTADVARINATVDAAEQALSSPGAPVAIGFGTVGATGAALRRLADATLADLVTTPVPEEEWAASPVARRWWKALTLRFGVDARAEVRRIGSDAVHARITADGATLAWAVEATAADAMAFAALAAVGVAQARAAGVPVAAGSVRLSGAVPARPEDNPETAGWTDDVWHWPAGVFRAEPGLQAGLAAALAPLAPEIAPHRAGAEHARLARTLAATSLVAVTYTVKGRP